MPERAGPPSQRWDRAPADTPRIDRVDDWLYVGPSVPPAHYRKLQSAGITHIVDLREEASNDGGSLEALGPEWGRRLPGTEDEPPTMGELIELAGWLMPRRATERVYLHCGTGLKRAPTMAAGLLIFAGKNLDEALRQVQAARPDMRITPAQQKWLHGVDAMRLAIRRIDRVTDWLQLGGAVPPDEYDRFRRAGITHVVDLREENEADLERLEVLDISRRHVPVADFHAPALEQLLDVDQWFKPHRGSGCLYVHCGGGFGRAATLAVALLVLDSTALDAAIERVRGARPEIRITSQQLEWLQTVEPPRNAS